MNKYWLWLNAQLIKVYCWSPAIGDGKAYFDGSIFKVEHRDKEAANK